MLRSILHCSALAAAVAVLAGSAAASGPTSAQRAVGDLLAGRDARAAVAQALAEERPQGAAHDASRSALTGYTRSLAELRRAIDAARASGAGRPALASAFAALRAQKLIVEARLDAVEAQLQARGVAGRAAQRWQSRRAAIETLLARVDIAARSAELALGSIAANAPAPHALLAELADIADASAAENRVPVHGANLPVHRPRLPAREPATTPVVVPAYANAAEEIEPVAADFASDIDTALAPEILAKAASLENNYARIVDFVHSEVRTQWYAGAQKGATGTLRTLSGNDVDQASLLVALLRASRAPARYVQGVVEVPAADLAASLAVRADKVGQALAAAGIANAPVIRGGRIAAYAIEHVYVTARLPLSNYRGTAADLDGETWVPLAPALKPSRFVPARGALAAAGVGARAFADEYIRAAQTQVPLDALRERVTQALARLTPPVAYADQLAQSSIDAPPLGVVPAGLPVKSVAVTGEFAQLPDRLRQRVRVQVGDGNGGTALDATLPLSGLVDRRVTLAYAPASIEDGNIADRYNGLGGVPPSLVDVRPMLDIAGMPARQGTGAIENGASHRIEVTVEGPGGSTSFAQTLTAGGLAALVFDAQADGPLQQADATTLPGESESPAARLLANLGARYLTAWDEADGELARLAGVGVVRPFPAVALVINRHAVARVAGVVDAMPWDGVVIDAALRPVEAFAGIAENRAESDWTELSALHGSALEHAVFEQQWAVESVSADKVLAAAVAQNIPVVQLSSSTGVAGLNQPAAVKDAISAWLGRGYVVDVPRDPVTVRSWTGAAWRVRALATGESGWFIAGGLAGGATAMPPALWYLQELVDLLGNAYGEPPNDDAQAGAILAIDRASQDQEGEAGTELAKPLRAIVTDENGRAVRGAQVLFRVMGTDSELLGPNGPGGQELVVTTDAKGIALVRLKLDTDQGGSGRYVLAPNDAFPQWQGSVVVEVRAASRRGTLAAGEAYRAWILPAAAHEIRFELIEPGSDVLTPGIGYKAGRLSVVDRYGNGVANRSVTLSAATATGVRSGQCSGGGVSPVGASLFLPGQCDANATHLTGNPCTSQSLDIVSRAGGAPFFVVPPATAPATVTLNASADPVVASVQMTTDAVYNACGTNKFIVIATSTYGHQHGATSWFSTVLDAAPPNQLIPVPKRVVVQYAWDDRSAQYTPSWLPITNATFAFNFGNGSAENLRPDPAAAGNYLFDVRAGSRPGDIEGRFGITLPDLSLTVNTIARAWVVDPAAPKIDPGSVELTPFSTTAHDFELTANYKPTEYIAAPLRIELLKDGEVLDECAQVSANGDFGCTYVRGMTVDPIARYTARSVIDDGTPFRMVSAETPITFGRNIVAGYGMLPGSASDPLDLVRIVQGYYPTTVSLATEVDVPTGYTCVASKRFGYLLSQDAKISLSFHRLGTNGEPTGFVTWLPLSDVVQTQGLQQVSVDTAHLPPGEYQYVLEAVANDGSKETYQGNASARLIRRDALPLAHSVVKGVDAYSGNASVSEEDIVIGGRGPGLSLTRMYSSQQSGAEPGFFGRGWSSDLDNQVIVTGCNERIVTGSAGQSQRFRPVTAEPDAEGTTYFEALHGYHGTLVQRGLEYDFYTTDGTRHHFGGTGIPGARLAFIEDTNGNRVTFTWVFDLKAPRVTRIADASGRALDLAYGVRTVQRNIAGAQIQESLTLLEAARGPEGLEVRYEYDAAGNLARATRTDASGKGPRIREYDYQDYKGLLLTQPDNQLSYTYFGHLLTAVRDGLSRDERRYDYETAFSVLPQDDGVWYSAEQRVKTLREPDDGVTKFKYVDMRGAGAVSTEVTDAREALTTYYLNKYGAADKVVDPAGETRTEWDLAAVQPMQVTDALGRVTSYGYDGYGNKTSEEIVHAAGTRKRTWTYVPSSAFGKPYIRNRVDIATDARRIETDNDYDARGNLTVVKRGGVSTVDGYDANGDRTTHTDGRGKLWKFRYDRYGQPTEAENPLGQVVVATYDARGRKTREVDPNGNATTWTYDARDRVLVATYPPTAAGIATETTTHDDARRESSLVNARGYTTKTVFDPMGRVHDVIDDIGTRSRRYDKNGNLETDTDREGHVTRYEYDTANRLRKKFEPEGRTTEIDVDALGHVTKETVADRIARYVYDDPEYRRTLAGRWLADAAGGRWLDAVTRYDENGNAVEVRDALNRTVTRVFDARDRLDVETAPLGRVTGYTYDGNDNVVEETRYNPRGSGTQVRLSRYDDANRLVETTDAENRKRSRAYDANGNIVDATDARGNVVHNVYDARNQLVERSGPEAGQRVTFGYDRNNNKTAERWANGRELAYVYDAIDRLERAEDAEGLVEKRKLDKDGLVRELTDADGRVALNTYDALHRTKTRTLPGPGPRTTTFGYGVHAEATSAKDARGHETTLVYDTLGRLAETHHPAVDGVNAIEKKRYDDAGNIVGETDARGNETEYFFNDLNQRIGQKDPADGEGRRFEQAWTYDAIGNVLTHTDRRGILSVTAFDKENRAIGHARDGLVLDTLVLDEEGNVALTRDALGRETSAVYDKANRKIKATAPLGTVSSWTYTPEGDVATSTDADGRKTTNTYTKRRYVETQELAGETTTYSYNGSGQRTKEKKPEGNEWLYRYDAGGRLEAIETQEGNVTAYGYDATDNRTSVKDANLHETVFAYDARNRLRSKTYPGGKATEWRYDADGNPTRTITPNGPAIARTYDALDRPVTTTYEGAAAGEAESTTQRYDGNGNVVRVEESIDGAVRAEARRYDNFDRLENVVDALGSELTYRYDDVGNRTHLTEQGGQETVWTYDALNRNDAVTVAGQGTTTQTFTKAGLIDVVTRPDGSTSDTDYDPAGRIARIAHAKAGQPIATYTYRYDLNGNRKEQRETNGAATGGGEIATAYDYDRDDRLHEVTEPDRVTTYTLDGVGNRTVEHVVSSGQPVSHSVLTYDARDQLTSRSDTVAGVQVTQTYDDNGNLKTQTVNGGAPRAYAYDARDRMRSLTQGSNAPLTFDYDANGLRIAKTQGSQTLRYQYDGASLIAERTAAGEALKRYHYSAMQLVSETKGGSTPVQRHYLLDALKTPIALLTQQGAVSARTRYDAWGEVVAQQGTDGQVIAPARDTANASLPSTDEQPVGFTGYYKDGESGLYYAKARYYDPAVARFTTEDPVGGEAMTPPSLHRYLYAYANPTVNTDRSGLCTNAWCAWFMGRHYARNDEEREGQDRALLRSLAETRVDFDEWYDFQKRSAVTGHLIGAVPVLYHEAKMLGEAAYAVSPTGMTQWSMEIAADAHSDSPEAKARTAALRQKFVDVATWRMNNPPIIGEVKLVAGVFKHIGESLGEHAGMFAWGIEKGDYVQQGEAIAHLGLDIHEINLLKHAGTKTAHVIGEARATAKAAAEARAAAAREARMRQIPDNDFVGDKLDRSLLPPPPLARSMEVEAFRFYEAKFPLMATNPWNQYRFSNPNLRRTGGDAYFSEHPGVAYEEVRHNVAGKNMWGGRLQVDRVLDLTDPAVAKAYGVDVRLINVKDAYAYPQAVGARARADGYAAIRFPSAQTPGGTNIVVLDGMHQYVKPQTIFDILQ